MAAIHEIEAEHGNSMELRPVTTRSTGRPSADPALQQPEPTEDLHQPVSEYDDEDLEVSYSEPPDPISEVVALNDGDSRDQGVDLFEVIKAHYDSDADLQDIMKAKAKGDRRIPWHLIHEKGY